MMVLTYLMGRSSFYGRSLVFARSCYDSCGGRQENEGQNSSTTYISRLAAGGKRMPVTACFCARRFRRAAGQRDFMQDRWDHTSINAEADGFFVGDQHPGRSRFALRFGKVGHKLFIMPSKRFKPKITEGHRASSDRVIGSSGHRTSL